ncbi:MAG: hypothetical protein OEY22_08545 [Candidatus Bathyarchaeota archaeon]|nr:hypothetical protein [Candidatus Bathyarchaeota archaeon]
MTTESTRCEFCKIEIPSETCKLAAYTTMIDGREYNFCCKICAEKYRRKKAK